MAAVIVSGGSIDTGFLAQELAPAGGRKPGSTIIAADRGLLALMRLHIIPDYIVGDFDSAGNEGLLDAESLTDSGSTLVRLDPVKDDTDTEAALRIAFERTIGDITIYGATGTRIDHVLGNICILRQQIKKKRQVFLKDPHNLIGMAWPGHPVTIRRAEQYGKYVSVIPAGGPAKGVRLTGFYYPLRDAVLTGTDSLGISNEITADTAEISVREGSLLVIQSKD